MNAMLPNLQPLPDKMAHLPIDRRGYPVPWFVAMVNGEPEFRLADPEKYIRAVKEKLCWVCGGQLGRYMVFVIGPMCGINRTTSEPPCHRECALYSVQNCPFLTKPNMVRRENDLPPESGDPGGHMIKRNPGVSLVWTTESYSLFNDGHGMPLIEVGPPHHTEWFALGKPATRDQVVEAVETGLPALARLCDTAEDRAELARRKAEIEKMYPM